jgi:hypothetical protein
VTYNTRVDIFADAINSLMASNFSYSGKKAKKVLKKVKITASSASTFAGAPQNMAAEMQQHVSSTRMEGSKQFPVALPPAVPEQTDDTLPATPRSSVTTPSHSEVTVVDEVFALDGLGSSHRKSRKAVDLLAAL